MNKQASIWQASTQATPSASGDSSTHLLPEAGGVSGTGSGDWSLRADLLVAVRRRLRLVALLLTVGFLIDPVVHAAVFLLRRLAGRELPPELWALWPLDLLALGAAGGSLGLWWLAGGQRVAARTLVSIGLVYEVVICFAISVLTFWYVWLEAAMLPQVTWVIGVIILFPLLVPAPPRQVLAAAVTSALMPLPALGLLTGLGLVPTPPASSLPQLVANPLLAAVFAWLGARVVHGLGRQVAAYRELGSYRLEARLGGGGMGEIWRARHRLLARPAAIKVIRPDLVASRTVDEREELVRRFQREAEVIASLRSPHTVTLFDFGIATDGAFYFVMELLEGLDAEALVRRHGPLPPARVVHILQQVCHSLAEAEARGVVHRDIKPANLFICRYGEDDDFVKVLDFGLAKVFRPASPSSQPDTAAHTIQGTPAYMAPEQATGDSLLDIRADIYGLGCVGYWLLTGRTVFAAGTAMGQLIAQSTDQPQPPSAQAPQPVPEALDRLLLQCLEKDPDRRPQTIAELSAALAALSLPTWTQEEARQWWEQPAEDTVLSP